MSDPVTLTADIWKVYADRLHSTIVIPTNGTYHHDGRAVMGKGLAADAVHRIPGLDVAVGKMLRKHGTVCAYFSQWRLITFPVKYEWYESADLSLIQQSAKDLQRCILHERLTTVLVPRVGCGNGRLRWVDVKPVLVRVLDHRSIFVTQPKEWPDEHTTDRRTYGRM